MIFANHGVIAVPMVMAVWRGMSVALVSLREFFMPGFLMGLPSVKMVVFTVFWIVVCRRNKSTFAPYRVTKNLPALILNRWI